MIWRRLFWTYIAILLLLCVLADTGVLTEWRSGLPPYSDTVGHFVLMGTAAFLCLNAYPGDGKAGTRSNAAAGWLTIFVVAEEFSQLLFTDRTFSWLDMAADFAGILCALLAFRFLYRRESDKAQAAVTDTNLL